MHGMWRREKWQKHGRPKAYTRCVLDAPVHLELPIPNCDYGKPALVYQSRHSDTTTRAFYTCGDQRVSSCLSIVHRMFLHICHEIHANFVELCF